ncbi:hypothetical protein COO60DRAFT_841782 [Scenedesmus sp. NREL 46B-D3]|nr:hypothetical protein COO60DRAFT_841782 [Scenedesmus sp. NREL 46B-D3]
MPRQVFLVNTVLLLLTLACCASASASGSWSSSRRLLRIQARVPDSTSIQPNRNTLLFECFCISTYPYVQHEKRFVKSAAASDVRAGKVPTCPTGGWQPGSAQYGSSGCRLIKGQLD